jgi:hypothetical protein
VIGGDPKIGWVLRYDYLWSEEDHAEVSSKERPAVVVLAFKRTEGRVLVRVVPITHRNPGDPTQAIEISAITKKRLGLDAIRSWIVLDHANQFACPGPDIRRVPGKNPATIYYGPLPPGLYGELRRRLADLIISSHHKGVRRTP